MSREFLVIKDKHENINYIDIDSIDVIVVDINGFVKIWLNSSVSIETLLDIHEISKEFNRLYSFEKEENLEPSVTSEPTENPIYDSMRKKLYELKKEKKELEEQLNQKQIAHNLLLANYRELQEQLRRSLDIKSTLYREKLELRNRIEEFIEALRTPKAMNINSDVEKEV